MFVGHSDESSVNDILALDILPRIKELIGSDLGDTIKVCYKILKIKKKKKAPLKKTSISLKYLV